MFSPDEEKATQQPTQRKLRRVCHFSLFSFMRNNLFKCPLYLYFFFWFQAMTGEHVKESPERTASPQPGGSDQSSDDNVPLRSHAVRLHAEAQTQGETGGPSIPAQQRTWDSDSNDDHSPISTLLGRGRASKECEEAVAGELEAGKDAEATFTPPLTAQPAEFDEESIPHPQAAERHTFLEIMQTEERVSPAIDEILAPLGEGGSGGDEVKGIHSGGRRSQRRVQRTLSRLWQGL